ncbi:MAG: leucine-rich repeat domain-containing protein [Lachnospiraceae bacterium]|nr:leucine-rich repeat domain-containing protein [Lachnospiraceae bacterium]
MRKFYSKKMALLTAAVMLANSLMPAGTVFASQVDEPIGDAVEQMSDDNLEMDISGREMDFNADEYSELSLDSDHLLDDEEDALGKDNVKADGYWHFSDGVLRYNKDSNGAIEDFKEFKNEYGDEIVKVVIESGPKHYSEDYSSSKNGKVEKCNFLPNLEEVIYESPVTLTNMCVMFESAYRECPKLRRLEVGDAAVNGAKLELGEEAFAKCPSLSEVKIGKRLWYTGKKTFYYCTGLTEFTFPDDIQDVRGDCFAGCGNMRHLKFSSKNEWMRIADDTVYEVKDHFKDIRGKAYITPCLMYVPEGIIKENGGDYTIIKGTKDVQWGAFQEDLSLKNVTVASTVESIQFEAFYGCENLKTVTLPRSLKRIGVYAFCGVKPKSGAERPLSPSITDIYYEGTEDEWKKIKCAEYNVDATKGHVNQLAINSTTTLYNHLEDVGIPADVTIHYNCPIKDTEKNLDELLGTGTDSGSDTDTPQDAEVITPSVNKVTVSYNGPGAKELATLGAKMEMTYTDELTYCGRKHVLTTSKPSASAINDLVADAVFKKNSVSENTSEFKVSKVTIKNGKNAGDKKAVKPPYFTIQIKAMKTLSKEDKAVLKEVNRYLKKDPNARFYFKINPMDVSSFNAGNIKDLMVNGMDAKIKKVGYKYSYMKDGSPYGGWKFLKQCKNNDAGAKGDYTLKVQDNNVVLTGHGNYTGTAVFSK